ncbi:MAG: tryptophan halogenase family protein [Pseudomonadota bacterium]
MTGDRRIREIVVAGNGVVGLSAAALLKRRIPGASVTLVGAPTPPEALADHIASTLPSITGFHDDLGIGESDVLRTGASFRLGTLFDGWSGAQPGYVHAYGEVGQRFGTTSFHLHWARLARSGKVAPFDSHSPAAALARAGRFVHPQGGPETPLGSFEYGLNLDPPRYREMLRAFARHVGVAERAGAIADVRLAENGFVEALLLDDGSTVSGHLFVDCTGPAALVRAKLDDRFEEWSRWLPCDRILIADGPGSPEPAPLDQAVAHAAGWRWQSACRAASSHGLVYASAQLSDSKAERVLRGAASIEPGAPIALRQGRRSQPWFRNCVAIGDSAVSIEPLEWANLHLAHSALDRLVAKMPDRDCAPVELWDYNRECAAEAERVRDFLVLHYAASDRPKDDFWRAVAAVEPPASLAHTLALFRERGRLPLYEEETFTRHSWVSVLLGQGVLPRRDDPVIDAIPPEQTAIAMGQMRENLAAMAASLPTNGAYLRQLPPGAPR